MGSGTGFMLFMGILWTAVIVVLLVVLATKQSRKKKDAQQTAVNRCVPPAVLPETPRTVTIHVDTKPEYIPVDQPAQEQLRVNLPNPYGQQGPAYGERIDDPVQSRCCCPRCDTVVEPGQSTCPACGYQWIPGT